ncbi:hypothetical protein BN1221_00609c [Brenneria goodwinii]|uniref:Uncharacterized protein n=1 Tax=Brenneria goodwinii TaxID=1109412 RepID=A0A0G4JQK5_9GAMM|nr:hypothetical protein BN1221_00609c [Brenneria goodwinii]
MDRYPILSHGGSKSLTDNGGCCMFNYAFRIGDLLLFCENERLGI